MSNDDYRLVALTAGVTYMPNDERDYKKEQNERIRASVCQNIDAIVSNIWYVDYIQEKTKCKLSEYELARLREIKQVIDGVILKDDT